ncbi:MAG TPA: kelch repeat-containing protein [Terriglobia bacterium]|nr:kelch repeat-containing protein [Terriglobia bacterium]
MKKTVSIASTSISILLVGCQILLGQGGTWTTEAPMPTPRAGSASGVVGGTLFVVGGGNSTWPSLSAVEAYDPVTNSWTTKAPIPTSVNGAAAGVVNGILYVVGGVTTGPSGGGLELNLVQAYNPKSDIWSLRTPMPTARDGMAVAVLDGILYAVGGFKIPITTPGGDVGTLEAYDPKSNTWASLAPMPTPRDGLALIASGGLLYAVGGFVPTRTPPYFQIEVGLVEVYDPKTNSWSTRTSMPTPRGIFSAAAIDGIIYAVGGSSDTVLTPTVDTYEPETDTWSSEAPMLTPRASLVAGVVGDVLYAVGGGNDKFLATNEAFTPFLAVAIEIKPNTINLKSNGKIEAVILSSNTFDATSVNPETVTLAGASVETEQNGTPLFTFDDVNGDGILDLIVHFRARDLQLTNTDTQAVLKGQTFAGQLIKGVATVRIVP